jgi:hypothetical protein
MMLIRNMRELFDHSASLQLRQLGNLVLRPSKSPASTQERIICSENAAHDLMLDCISISCYGAAIPTESTLSQSSWPWENRAGLTVIES